MSSAKVKAGEDFKITISIKNNPGIVSAKFSLEYGEGLKAKKVTFGKELGGMTNTSPSLDSPATLNWISPTEELAVDTEYATIDFSTDKSAANGDHEINISYDPQDVFNLKNDVIDFTVKNGVVTVSGGSDAKEASSTTSSAASADAAETPVTDSAKSTEDGATNGGYNDGNGDYVGEEITLEYVDENGNPVDDTKTTGEKETKPIWVYAVIAALLLAGGVAIFIIKKKTDNKPVE